MPLCKLTSLSPRQSPCSSHSMHAHHCVHKTSTWLSHHPKMSPNVQRVDIHQHTSTTLCTRCAELRARQIQLEIAVSLMNERHSPAHGTKPAPRAFTGCPTTRLGFDGHWTGRHNASHGEAGQPAELSGRLGCQIPENQPQILLSFSCSQIALVEESLH